jgi:hypothetical protein
MEKWRNDTSRMLNFKQVTLTGKLTTSQPKRSSRVRTYIDVDISSPGFLALDSQLEIARQQVKPRLLDFVTCENLEYEDPCATNHNDYQTISVRIKDMSGSFGSIKVDEETGMSDVTIIAIRAWRHNKSVGIHLCY